MHYYRVLNEITTIPLDILEEDDKYVIIADVPGVKPEDVDVSLTFDHVEIAIKIAQEDEESKFIHREIPTGSVRRKLSLSKPIKSKEATMELNNGTLMLVLPYAEEAKKVSLKIN